jgi:hypothetical protein
MVMHKREVYGRAGVQKRDVYREGYVRERDVYWRGMCTGEGCVQERGT